MPVEINRTLPLEFDISVYHLLVIRLLSSTLCLSWPQWCIVLLQAGVRQIQVAESSTRLKSRNSRLWWGYRATGSLAEQHPSAYRFTAQRKDRYRVLAAKRNRSQRHADNRLLEINNVTVHPEPVRRLLHALRPNRVPDLCRGNSAERLEWAQNELDWTDKELPI